jgi:hypothetical protein
MNPRDQKFYIIERNEVRNVPQQDPGEPHAVMYFSSPFNHTTKDYYCFSALILEDYFNGEDMVDYLVLKYAGDFSVVLLDSWKNKDNEAFKLCGITIREYLWYIDEKQKKINREMRRTQEEYNRIK